MKILFLLSVAVCMCICFWCFLFLNFHFTLFSHSTEMSWAELSWMRTLMISHAKSMAHNLVPLAGTVVESTFDFSSFRFFIRLFFTIFLFLSICPFILQWKRKFLHEFRPFVEFEPTKLQYYLISSTHSIESTKSIFKRKSNIELIDLSIVVL